MKKYLSLLAFVLATISVSAQQKFPSYPDSLFSTYYHQKLSLFRSLPQTKDDIIFVGNSITDGGLWTELFNDKHIKNRGISGDITIGVLNRLDEIVKRKPAKVFLLIGVNDLARNVKADTVIKNILSINQLIHQYAPSTKVFIQSILPVNPSFKTFKGHTNKGAEILYINQKLASFAKNNQYSFINLYSSFLNDKGWLKESFTNDGLHLKGDAYLVWQHLIYPYVYESNAKPALIPYPQSVKWEKGYYQFKNINTVLSTDKYLAREASLIRDIFKEKGLDVNITNHAKGESQFIELGIDRTISKNEEAYQLLVTENRVSIKGVTAHAVYNGIQTFRQLWRSDMLIDACTIIDEPAFGWRGYMVDVGRNYMSMELLKEQIDMMSRYKYNVFHFHPTEDVAWRISIKQYPQLTAPEYMLRNKGMYYTQKEIQELIHYCQERYITFVPEIDMPGHSEAFKRAMGADMQSDSGMVYVKNILKEFCDTYNVPYIHIGADEVKITNKNFLPEMTAYLESRGKKVIGWQPGGNFSKKTILQLWKDNNDRFKQEEGVNYIDSRHLYLNHMDPLEAVTSIYNHKIGVDGEKNNFFMGATLCLWHDRAVRDERDLLTMNPVYPGMLAFTERVWNGGGKTQWVANINDGDVNGFINFESRLLDHKKEYFRNLPFPYVKQSNLSWNLIGPFNHNIDIEKKANSLFNNNDTTNAIQELGGTVVMRHWWHPLIQSAIDDPKPNTVWFATTSIWSDEEEEKNFWIGFNNISRSPNTDSPPANAWDDKGSQVWVNQQRIEAPDWARANQKGNSEIPLIDEGYEYRTPTTIRLKKGWNKVVLALPVGSFSGRDWHNPVKWMFTFVPIDVD
ncbi:MAG: beta-N-acetylhexosaminidase [Chitinophagaceae bacterium]|nr:MAG: beta-N-acetylhexosaminidase [Chitinophagaceae bacterium]